jgi:hypothetical protein
MTNRDLLKEAIADAKAVKETAIANAKAVLEEVFTKNLRAELASKLEEMDNDENKEVEEAMKAKKEFEVNEMEDEIDEEFDLNEILAELEEGEDKEEMKEAEAEEEMEAGEAEMEAGEEAEDMGEEEIDLEDMTEDDLKSFIEDVIADMVAAGELEAGEEMEAEMGDMEAEEEMGDMEELDEMDEVTWERQNGESLKDLAPTKVGQTTVNEAEETKTPLQEIDAAMLQDIGQQFLQIIKTDPSLLPMDVMLPILTGGVASIFGAGFGISKLMQILKSGKLGAKGEALANDIESAAGASGINKPRVSEVEDEMDKIEELKKELQEVNLLNAKLLYTNKIFNSKNLNESQKLRVLKAFDKATSVKEAKVIYETLNEGMTSKTVKTSMMNEIKGSASKATGFISESKQPIVEVDPMVARWQKLAGIK